MEVVRRQMSGDLPEDHPAYLSSTFVLSTLPAEKVLGGGGGGGGRGGKGGWKPPGGGNGGGGGRGVVSKQEKDKKTIARLKKLIKYKGKK